MNALLIIDVQRGMFANPDLQPHDGDAVVGRIAALLAAARAGSQPVIFVQHAGGPGDPLEAGSPGFAFHAALTAGEAEPVFVKSHCSAFQDTGLAGYLAQAGITGLVICGMQTEFCVDTTCRAAAERGYAVTLVSDGHTTFETENLTVSAIIRHHNNILADGFGASLRPAAAVATSFAG